MKPRRSSPSRKSRTRKSRSRGPRGQRLVAFATILVVAAGAALLFARPYLRTAAATAEGAEPDATLAISMGGWQPAEIRAEAGRAITVRMINLDNRFHTDGGGWHNFVVPTLGVSQEVPPEGTLTFDIAALEPGEYLFYCDICCGGKDNPYMQGKLIVS